MIEDRKIGKFKGNLFLLLADKFPFNTRKTIIENVNMLIDCDIILRNVPWTKHLGYFINYPKEEYTILKDVLNTIYRDIPQEAGYPDVYNQNNLKNMPSIHISADGTMVVWVEPAA